MHLISFFTLVTGISLVAGVLALGANRAAGCADDAIRRMLERIRRLP